MGSEEATTAPAGADNPQETRNCSRCEDIVIVTPETWPYRKGRRGIYAAYGSICMTCEKQRKAAYEERRGNIAKLVNDVPVPPEADTPEAHRKAIVKANKLDVAQALKAGSIAVNQLAPGVMARIMEYLEDPEHKNHLWALELLAQRILPRKLYEELGGEAAGTGGLQDKRPTFVLNVLPAGAERPGGVVYDHEGSVQLLPLSPEADAG